MYYLSEFLFVEIEILRGISEIGNINNIEV